MKNTAFRVWDGQAFNYFDFSDPTYFVNGNHGLLFRLQCRDFNADCQSVFQQSIGCKSKNRKEIFEGDIVTLNDHYESEYHGGEVEIKTFAVVYDKRSAAFMLRDKENKRSLISFSSDEHCLDVKSIKVIGNIFENPELFS